MANLRETATWEAGIYQWETSDPVMGGENGIDNKPTRQLANRTQWLKTELAKAVSSIGNNKTAADEAIALKANAATRLTAGNGLTGGGDLSANRTITLGTPSRITATTTNSVGTNTHTHEIDNASTTVAGVVKLNDTLSSQSASEALTAKQGRVLALQIAAAVSGSFPYRGELNQTQDLDTLKGAENYGVWRNHANVYATSANHYPLEKAGTLFVLPSAYQGVQVYIPFDRAVWYVRATRDANSAYRFGNWQAINETVNALNSESTTAALSAAMGKNLAEKIDNKDSLKTINYDDNPALGYNRTGFYRGSSKELNGKNLPSMEIHITHPTQTNNAYARGIGFTYGGDFGLSTTAWGGDGTYLGQKTILTELNGVMLSGDQTISGTKTFSGSLKTTSEITSGAGITISGSNKTARFGMGTSDCFIHNPTAKKYLQLKDNGELAYSDDKIILQSMLSNAINSSSSSTVASSKAVKTAYDKANDANSNANSKSVVTVMTGTLNDGGTIPLPSGYSEAQCRWLVSVNDDNINRAFWDINENGGHLHYRFECYTTGRVVKCRTYRHNHHTDDNIPGRANYIIIGVK
ncbi:pyocin knob domain-containing protein [Neisseriaceae bacterium B1]